MAFIVNRESFQVLRDSANALPLTPGEKAGPVLNTLAETHVEQAKIAFDTHGATTGQPWAPWSAAYAAWRRKHNTGESMLRLTDTLYEKVTTLSHPNFYRAFVEPNTYQFGFLDEVGAWHVTGTTKMPKRSMMDKTEQDVQDFLRTFLEYWKNRTLAIIRNRGKLP